jgi:hypothetical protein
VTNKFKEIKERIRNRTVALATMLSVVAPTTALAKETSNSYANPSENTIENVVNSSLSSDMVERDTILQTLDDVFPATNYTEGFDYVHYMREFETEENFRAANITSLDKLPDAPNSIMNMPDIEMKPLSSTIDPDAFYHPIFNKIILHNELADSVKDYYPKEGRINHKDLMLAGLHHEIGHYQDYKINGMNYVECSPANIARAGQFTEIKSKSIEFLYLANMYVDLKNKGIDTIEFDGKQKPLEEIMEAYPTLREHVLANGFDANDKDSVRQVVKVAQKYWMDVSASYYKKRGLNCAKLFTFYHWIYGEQRANDTRSDMRIYDDFTKRALRDVYIGNNLRVDLSHCKDLIDCMSDDDALSFSKEKHDIMQKYLPSAKTVSAIYDYLENEKGITDDYQKYKYYRDEYFKILKRETKYKKVGRSELSGYPKSFEYYNSLEERHKKGFIFYKNENGRQVYYRDVSSDYDHKLKDIIAQNEGKITYADGIVEYFEDGKRVAVEKDGKKYDLKTNTSNKNDLSNDVVSKVIDYRNNKR